MSKTKKRILIICISIIPITASVYAYLYFNFLRYRTPFEELSRPAPFSTELRPETDELLLRRSPEYSDIRTFYSVEGLFSSLHENPAHDITSAYELADLPDEYYYITYLPDTIHPSASWKTYYIAPENIGDLNSPLILEEDENTSVALLTAATPYDKQLRYHLMICVPEVSVQIPIDPAQYENTSVNRVVEGFNELVVSDNMFLDFTNVKTMKQSFLRGGNGTMKIRSMKEYDHPLFDKAYIVEYKLMGYGDYIEFTGSKRLKTPITAYNFDECDVWLTEENIDDYLVTYDSIQFSIIMSSSNPNSSILVDFKPTKKMMIDIVQSIKQR